MEIMYSEKAKNLCMQCMNIGRELEQVAITQNAAEALEQIAAASNLKVIAVASSHSNAKAVVAEILGAEATELLPKLDVQSSATIRYVYGDASNVQTIADDEQGSVTVEIQLELPILQKLELQVYVSAKSFTEYSWKKILTSGDFVFLVVSALRMFNQAEKNFMQSCVKKYVGSARFAAIIADLDMINSEEDYQDLQVTANWHLSTNGMNTDHFEIGADTLSAFVSEKLLADAEKMHHITAEHIGKMCCEDTKSMLEKLLAEADEDVDALVDALAELKKRSSQMQKKGNITANMAYGDISGTLTYNATQGIHQFFGQLEEQVAKTLEETENIQATLDILPDYLSASLSDYKENLSKALRADANDLAGRLCTAMIEDAGEFLGNTVDVATELTITDYFDTDYQDVFTLPENQTKKKVETISKVLLIGSIPVLLTTGFVAAAGTAVASRMVKKHMQGKIDQEDKNNALEAVHNTLSDLERELTEELRSNLKKLAEDTENKVKNAYSGFVASVMTLVNDKLYAVEQANARRSDIMKMLEQLQELCR